MARGLGEQEARQGALCGSIRVEDGRELLEENGFHLLCLGFEVPVDRTGSPIPPNR